MKKRHLEFDDFDPDDLRSRELREKLLASQQHSAGFQEVNIRDEDINTSSMSPNKNGQYVSPNEMIYYG